MKNSAFNLQSSWIAPLIEQLYGELANKGIHFRPHIWVSDDWFCPDGISGFAVPFWLLDPKLIEQEKRARGFCEGEDKKECMMLLRHECGHAIDNAFELFECEERTQLFGNFFTPYPKSYGPRPYSKKYVHHLKDHYAQSHPAEDWAETFAVWLTPKSQWKTKYAQTGALKKLSYIQKKMNSLKGQRPLNHSKEVIDEVSSLPKDLDSFFKKRKQNLSGLTKKEISPFLKKEQHNKAFSQYLKRERQEIIQKIAKKTQLPHYGIKNLINGIESHYDLYLSKSSEKDFIQLLGKKTPVLFKKGKHKVLM